MMRPAVTYSMTTGPVALDEVRLSARPQLPDHAAGNVANRLESVSSRCAYAARPPGRACTTRVARPFPFLSGLNADHLSHVVAPICVSVVADEKHCMERMTWSDRTHVESRQNS